MPVSRPRTALASVVGLAAAGLLLAPAPAEGAPWRAPVAGPIVARFAVGADPFAAGQRRGVDFAARRGAAVGAPCGGRVSFAGGLPEHGGTVAIRCGGLTATVLGLALPLRVRAGATVVPGSRIGAAAGSGRVRLGARRTAHRFGYVDPERLLSGSAAPRPPVVPVGGRRLGRGPSGPAPGDATVAPDAAVVAPHAATVTLHAAVVAPHAAADASPAAPVPSPRAAAPSPAAPVPPAAWAGLALVAAALPTGTLVARRRRRPRWTAAARTVSPPGAAATPRIR